MRKKVVKGIILLALLVGITIFGPYNVILEFNETNAVQRVITSDKALKGLKIVDVDYRGSDTYFIQTSDGDRLKNFIVMKDYTSVMNGNWKVFEQMPEEHPF
ncbi:MULTISPECIES: hypothetical protein [Pontibacillus]|uniref:DUF3139 domain-containing protein n=1 Tax=Pontibacillus chungwhensis TaxID=265426 RepID=A0ABY8V3L2_9BACI|nr:MULTISPECIES: hypothetical protein [Pontibacillus]MCD5322309.1 hypothetical protein [Pontibacillus sp. HN14]WIF99601.1 hypothetical protein QNI29_08070 [Pontibacillus chungwhensis]